MKVLTKGVLFWRLRLEKNLQPSSLRLSAEFTSLRLLDWCPVFSLAASWRHYQFLEAAFRSPSGGPLTTWHLSSSRPSEKHHPLVCWDRVMYSVTLLWEWTLHHMHRFYPHSGRWDFIAMYTKESWKSSQNSAHQRLLQA